MLTSFLTFLLYYETNPFDLLEVKWLNSHIFMSYVDARTYVMFNWSVDAKYLERE